MSEESNSNTAGSSKLDTLNKEELVKLVKKYVVLQKQLKSKNEELSNKLNEKNDTESLKTSMISINSNDDFFEKDKIKDLELKISELNHTNAELVDQNLNLKNKIENLNEELNKQVKVVENSINQENSANDVLNKDIFNSIKDEPIIKQLTDETSKESIFRQIDKILNSDGFSIENAIRDTFRLILNNLKSINDKYKLECERVVYIEDKLANSIKDFKNEISSLQSKLDENQIEFINYKLQAEAKIKNFQQDKSEKEVSKTKLLGLEIADYEKTVKSLNLQLITKEKEINDLKQHLTDSNEHLAKLKQEFITIQDEKEGLSEKCTKLKQLLVKSKKEANDVRTQEAELQRECASVKAQLESVNFQVDSYKLQVADISTERQKLLEKIQILNDNQQRSVALHENKKRLDEEQLEDTKKQLNNLRNEFESYKIKVQTAFKKQKETNDTQIETNTVNELGKLGEELEKSKSTITKLNEELNDMKAQIQMLKNENSSVHQDYSSALERNSKLIAELKQKEDEWKEKSENLITTSLNKSQETKSLLENLKIENEAITLNFKEKIKQLNVQSNQTIHQLENQLKESKDEIERLNSQLNELGSRQLNNLSDKQFSLLNISTQTNTSANHSRTVSNVSISSPQSSYSFSDEAIQTLSPKTESKKSLEELLGGDLKSSVTTLSSYESRHLINQLESHKQELNKGKVQLIHLNELLNESELNNARLTDQINLLKEEIRRLERNQERETSISNMEYLKNVVLKFLTFSSQQEKTQLLPVLSQMLKLSQEEQNAIMSRSSYPNQTDQSGWSSYLPKW